MKNSLEISLHSYVCVWNEWAKWLSLLFEAGATHTVFTSFFVRTGCVAVAAGKAYHFSSRNIIALRVSVFSSRAHHATATPTQWRWWRANDTRKRKAIKNHSEFYDLSIKMWKHIFECFIYVGREMRATTHDSDKWDREDLKFKSECMTMMCRAFDEWWKTDFACGEALTPNTRWRNKFRFLPRHACSHARTFSLFYRSMLMHPT